MKNNKILFLTPYPHNEAPSQRFRFEQYYSFLTSAGFELTQTPFWSNNSWKILYQKGHFFKKSAALLKAILKRYFLLFQLAKYDFVFIHREFSPVGFPFGIWVIKNIWKKKIIYDFDDAIWLPNVSESNQWTSRLKNTGNTAYLCKVAYKISCGNDFLKRYAEQFNSSTFLIPTTIDTENYHNVIQAKNHQPFVIGWTGSHSTIKYLEIVVPVIEKIAQKHPIVFRVISDKKPVFQLACLEFISWKKQSEIEDLAAFSIGLMPLKDDDWSRGKCGFKALQYMALGTPALVSPVGANIHIVDHNENGYFCENLDDWEKYILHLIKNPSELARLSANTRPKVEQHYSVNAVKEPFLALFS